MKHGLEMVACSEWKLEVFADPEKPFPKHIQSNSKQSYIILNPLTSADSGGHNSVGEFGGRGRVFHIQPMHSVMSNMAPEVTPPCWCNVRCNSVVSSFALEVMADASA